MSTGSLYSNVVPFGYTSGVMLDLTSGCFFLGSATTNCGVLSTTRTVAGTLTNSLPSLSVTITLTCLSPVDDVSGSFS